LNGAGLPKSEMSVKGSAKIEVLSPEEIEGMRVVCRVSINNFYTIYLYNNI
jgi:hypothetical protein